MQKCVRRPTIEVNCKKSAKYVYQHARACKGTKKHPTELLSSIANVFSKLKCARLLRA